MNILDILSSVNKIALAAFVVMLSFLIYEIYLFSKEKKTNKKVDVPVFKEGMPGGPGLIREENVNNGKTIKIILIFVLLLGVVAGILLIAVTYVKDKSVNRQVPPSKIVQIVRSRGIRIFDADFKPLGDVQVLNLKTGDRINIGLDSITGTDVDKARIMVNKNDWSADDETASFNKEQNVYFILYTIKGSDVQLKIKAQLHSHSIGWLGD